MHGICAGIVVIVDFRVVVQVLEAERSKTQKEVLKARMYEMEFTEKKGVWRKVPRKHAKGQTAPPNIGHY